MKLNFNLTWAGACLSRMMSLTTRSNGRKSRTTVLHRLVCCVVLFAATVSPAALGEPLDESFPITFDATALDTVNFNLDFSATLGGPNVVTTLLLQPGNHNFHAPASHQTAIIPITVTSVGTIDFDPIFDSIASGRGTDTLTVTGLPITFDATTLDTINFNVDFSAAGGGANVATTLRLLPGDYSYRSPASHQTAIIPITVTPTGTIDFDPIFDSVASGRGTDTLTVTGLPITFDATTLDTSNFNVDFSAAGGGVNVATTLRLLPGDYSYRSPASHQTAIIPITVTSVGTIDFDPLFDSVASGRDTDTLTVTGLPFTFDATALDTVSFNLDFSFTAGGPNVVTTLRMLPGDYSYRSPGSHQTAIIPITLLYDGTIDFDSFFDSIASGRETDTLVATGVTIRIAAASSGDATFTLGSGVSIFSTADCQVLQLLPGVYVFNSASSAFLLEITQLGTFDYDPSLDTLIAGRGTDTLAFLDENGVPDTCDTDGDGLLDTTEIEMAMGSGCPSPTDADSDDDGLSDGEEVDLGTDPCDSDSDGDGVGDATDPTPLIPGVPPEFLDGLARDLCTAIGNLDLSLFNGPNNNANKGRRNSLANRACSAANAIADNDIDEAIDKLLSLLAKIDGESQPPDWMDLSDAKTAVAIDVSILIALLLL